MTAPQSSVPKTASPREGWIALPPDLVRRLGAFRRRVRRIKLFEAACAALGGVAVGFLILFLLDRVSDTPAWARGLLFAAAIAEYLAVTMGIVMGKPLYVISTKPTRPAARTLVAPGARR